MGWHWLWNTARHSFYLEELLWEDESVSLQFGEARFEAGGKEAEAESGAEAETVQGRGMWQGWGWGGGHTISDG